MAAAVPERGRLTIGAKKQHDVLIKQAKRFGPILKSASGITAYQKRRRTFCLVVNMEPSFDVSYWVCAKA